jgi:phosphotriesterase-related protein
MKYIETVTGPVGTDKLGQTLMHEHVYCGSWEMRQAFGDRWMNRANILRIAVEQLKRAKARGISTIVDGTPINLGRDIRLLMEAAEQSGVRIIASSGLYYTHDFFLQPCMADRITRLMIDECINGMQGTPARPGILKCATGPDGIGGINKVSLHCTMEAHKATGLPVFAHSSEPEHIGMLQLEYFRGENADLKKIIIGHCGETDDLPYLLALLESGCRIGFDRFNKIEGREKTENRIKNLFRLKEKGLLGKVLVSEDHWIVCDSLETDWDAVQRGGNADHERDFTYFHRIVMPLLRQGGFTEGDFNTILVNNPRDLFEQD